MEIKAVQKAIRPSWIERKPDNHAVCAHCGAKLNCMPDEEKCPWECCNKGGPEDCREIYCNMDWWFHDKEAHEGIPDARAYLKEMRKNGSGKTSRH